MQKQNSFQPRHPKDAQGTTHENNAVPWETIQTWIQHNPKKYNTLPTYRPIILPYEDIMEPVREAILGIPVAEPANTYDFEDTLSIPENVEIVQENTTTLWKTINISPICPMGFMFYGLNPKIGDDFYFDMKETERRTHHREYCMTAQTTGLERIKSRKFPKNKTIDAIIKSCFEEGLHSWNDLCWESMAAILEVQICLVDDHKKTVKMFPEDMRTWTTEKPVFYGSPDARYFYTPPNEHTLVEWIASKETDGYVFAWPEHDDKVVNLKELCNSKGWEIPPKIKKAELIVFVGKMESLEILQCF